MLPRYLVTNIAKNKAYPALKTRAEAIEQVLTIADIIGEPELSISVQPVLYDGLADMVITLLGNKETFSVKVVRHVRKDTLLITHRAETNPLGWLGKVRTDGWYGNKTAVKADPVIDKTLPDGVKPRTFLIVYMDLDSAVGVVSKTLFTGAYNLTKAATAKMGARKVKTTNDTILLKQHLDQANAWPEFPSGRGAVYLYSSIHGIWQLAAKRYIN
jgi:hypothetical protein